jgi:hypothetical protein
MCTHRTPTVLILRTKNPLYSPYTHSTHHTPSGGNVSLALDPSRHTAHGSQHEMQDPLSAGGGASSRASELTDGYDLDGYDDGYVEEADTDFVSGYAGMMSREDGEWAPSVVSTVGEWAPSVVSTVGEWARSVVSVVQYCR